MTHTLTIKDLNGKLFKRIMSDSISTLEQLAAFWSQHGYRCDLNTLKARAK